MLLTLYDCDSLRIDPGKARDRSCDPWIGSLKCQLHYRRSYVTGKSNGQAIFGWQNRSLVLVAVENFGITPRLT